MLVDQSRDIVLKFNPNIRIGIVHARENKKIVDILVKGAVDRLVSLGVKQKNIIIQETPGLFELPYHTKLLLGGYHPRKLLDAIIPIGVIIKGSDMLEYNLLRSQLRQMSVDVGRPIIFGILPLSEAECGEKLRLIQDSMYVKGKEWGSAAVEMGDLHELLLRRR